MKKLLTLVLCIIIASTLLVACGSNADKDNKQDETINPLGPSIRTEGPKTEAETNSVT